MALSFYLMFTKSNNTLISSLTNTNHMASSFYPMFTKSNNTLISS